MKQQLEDRLAAAFENGFVPAGIDKPEDSGPLRVIPKDGEGDRITVIFRTIEENHTLGDNGEAVTTKRAHNNQFIYTQDEVKQLLEQYEKGVK